MAFRHADYGAAPEAGGPLTRFIELHAAFESARRFYEDRASIRFTSAMLVSTPGDSPALVSAIRRGQRALRSGLGPFAGISPSVLLVLAAVLQKRGDEPATFVSGFLSTRARFRRQGLRRSPAHELLTYAVLRGQVRGASITDAQIRRVEAIYAAFRRDHYMLTGVEDLPACALLSGLADSPEAIGSRAEALYRALQRIAGWRPGESLHTASHLLARSDVDATTMAARAQSLDRALREGGYRVRGRDYDETALLCTIAMPVDKVVRVVLETTRALGEQLGLWRRDAFSLAVSVAFVQRLQGHEGIERLSEVKLLRDMQAIVAAGGIGAT